MSEDILLSRVWVTLMLFVLIVSAILQYSFQQHTANYVSLQALEDVIVMNQKRISQSTGYASYGRSKYHIAGTGGSRSTGITIGDIVFVSQGRPFITLNPYNPYNS